MLRGLLSGQKASAWCSQNAATSSKSSMFVGTNACVRMYSAPGGAPWGIDIVIDIEVTPFDF